MCQPIEFVRWEGGQNNFCLPPPSPPTPNATQYYHAMDYVIKHPAMHHPLETHHKSVVDELSYHGSTLVIYSVNPPSPHTTYVGG
jgi:hypothetical protein